MQINIVKKYQGENRGRHFKFSLAGEDTSQG
jgi:hypothetical protein